MKALPSFVDMAHTPKDIKEEYSPEPLAKPVYPYGLSICLGNDELEKLDLDDDVCVGDHLYLDCIVKVTSVSSNETTEGANRRVEMVITHIAVEDAEEEASEHMNRPKVDLGKLYNAE